ncbi:MAG TPA: histidine kinase dimerization/phospho-acceptor domain-containing protein [Vicinamibacterales bacterium]|nr:histidine kinase dimerization/phospho-acceptor domain-containing protein [Vicinamibacterales bacterium]
MPVDIHDILHVLAHELRTPVGIAHGYVRLLLEERLHQETDRRRALEQMQKALGRLSDLSYESTALATWYEQDHTTPHPVAARTLIERVAEADYEWPVTVDSTDVVDGRAVLTADEASLSRALIGMVRATARELRGTTCDVTARVVVGCFEMLTGPEELLGALGAGPAAPDAGPVALERGGLGLTLVHAAIVLDAHGAQRWTINGSRQTLGLRLPLDERRDS